MGTQRFAQHRAKALGFVFAALGLAAGGGAHAGVWDTTVSGGLGCGTSGCHTLPPAIANAVADGVVTNYGLGLGESWMGSAALLQGRANSATFASGSMASLTLSDATLVWNYLRQIRDGVVGNQVGTPSFASAAIGVQTSTSNSFTFDITNYRGAALNYALSTTGTNAGDFSVNLTGVSGTGCTTSQLPATAATSGATCTVTVTVTFAPTSGSAGSRSAAVRVTLSDPGGVVTPITGADKTLATFSATATTPVPGFQLSTASIAFGSLQVGTSSAATTVTITNPPSATANLVLGAMSAASFSGTNPGDFAVSSGATNSCTLGGTTLAPNSSCNVRVTFTPGAKGARSATLTVPNNAGAGGTVSLTGTGLQGTISLGAATVAVGGVNQGSSGTASLSVTNTGDWPITFSSFPVTGTGASEFVASGCASPLNNGAPPCTLTITFTPTNTTPRSVTLTVNGNASNAPTATLTGTGVALANPTVSPTSTSFPSTLVTVTSGTTRTITIANPRANALTVARAFSGTNATDFAVSGGSCGASPFSVAGGGSCTLVLSYTPAAGPGAGSRSGSLDLSFTGFNTDPSPAPQSVAITATAEIPTPVVSVPSTTLSFAAVVGTPTTTTTTVTNAGTGPLTLGTLTPGGAFSTEYTLAAGNTCTPGLTIPITPGSNTCTLAVQFNPASASPSSRGGTLVVTHNAAGGSTTFTLAGTATPAPQPALDIGGITTLPFGSVPQGSTGQQTVTVLNNGAAPLSISALTVAGANAADFTRTGTCSTTASVAVSTSCTIVLTFAPAAAGARSASLTITSNASNLPTATVTLSGTGVALADPVLSPNPVTAFPTTLTGTTSATTRVVTLSNPRANSLTYARAFSGANAAEFSAVESCATRVVPAGGSCTLTLQFAPAAAGTRTASLDFTFTGFNLDPSPAPQSLALSGTAVLPSPTFSASTNAMNFAAVVGTPGTSTAVITNTGSATLTLSNLSISGVSAAEFSLATGNTCTAGTSLAPSANCTLAIRYAPAAAGTSTAALTVTHNATGSPSTITLAGTATPAPQGRIALSATSLTFATTQVGSASSQLITVQNTGDLALTFSAFTIGGTNPADFARGGTCATATPLAIGAQCTLLVSFQPTAPGTRSASLTVQSDASNGAATIAVTGTAVPAPAPVVTLSTALLDFGAQTVGGVYPARSVTLTNSGNADLTTIGITVQGAGFSNASAAACPAILAAGASCTVDIRFAPTAAATDYTGSLRVTSNAAGSPHVTGLTGRGTAAVVPVLAWSPAVARLDFGQVEVGSVSATQSATVLNQGPGGVTLTLLNALGPDGAAFSVGAGSCAIGQVLFEGQSCRIDVRFAPGASGAKTATVQVASTGSAPAELVLAGTGLGGPSPALSLSVATLAFNGVRVGALSLPQEVTLSASGSGSVSVSALATSGPFTVQGKTCPAVPFTLAAGSECTLSVVFAPQTDGAATGKLTVTTDIAPTAREVALGGSGEAEPEVSSGGCTIASGSAGTDPTLWALLLGAAAALLHRRRARRNPS